MANLVRYRGAGRGETGVADRLGGGIIAVEVITYRAGLDEYSVDTDVGSPVESFEIGQVGDRDGQRAIGERAVGRRVNLQFGPDLTGALEFASRWGSRC